MAVLAIAGSGRGAGKTAVGCALLAALPQLRWLAVKVTPHAHDAPPGGWEGTERDSNRDTGRYRTAGARRSLLVCAESEPDAAARVAEARERASECDSVLVESNRIAPGSIARPHEPTLFLAVLAGPQADWKPSLADCLGRVDALVLGGDLAFQRTASKPLGKPSFCLPPAAWSTPELIQFARRRLLAKD